MASSFDLITDVYVLYKVFGSKNVGLLSLMLMTLVWPLLVSFVPFISYWLSKLREI